MEENIRNNIFVMTRDLVKDYHWVCKPNFLNASSLENTIANLYGKLQNNGIFTSQWYQCVLDNKHRIVFRIVVDGRKDAYGRFIRRYEGSSYSEVTLESLKILEKCLQELQEKTGNYGLNNFSSQERKYTK